jgi:predicted MPP superfamily phosphohydrolase
VAPFKNMKAPQGVFFITGNHEEFGDSTAFINAVKSVGIRTLVDEKTEVDGVEIIGVDYHNASDKKQFAHILSKLAIDKAKPSILLKHEPKDIDVARDAGISLQISGHTHRGQLWPFEYMAKLVYKGFSYGLKSLGTTQVYVSSGVGTWGPPMRVGTDGEIVVFTLK